MRDRKFERCVAEICMILFFAMVLFLAFMPAHCAHASVVAKDGSGNYKTIAAAVAKAKANEVITVKNGTYKESFIIKVPGVTLRNYAGHSPVLDCTGIAGCCVKVGVATFTFEGITVKNVCIGVNP